MNIPLSVACRENNKKRNFLLVNKKQAKHIPVAPHKALQMFDKLAEKIIAEYNPANCLVIGFAETATALGMRVAYKLGCDYIHTTREDCGDEYIEFSESHSHATEQKLAAADYSSYSTIIIIDDEFTTGKTANKLIEALKPHTKADFILASLFNGMPKPLKEKPNVCYLYDVDIAKAKKKAAKQIAKTRMPFETVIVPEYTTPNHVVNSIAYHSYCYELARHINISSNKSVLVVGTEECMYPAIELGAVLEQNGCKVKCHSTTRSPISLSEAKNYPFANKHLVESPYDTNRTTYIYNLDRYDYCVLVTDAPEGQGLVNLYNLLSGYGKKMIVCRLERK